MRVNNVVGGKFAEKLDCRESETAGDDTENVKGASGGTDRQHVRAHRTRHEDRHLMGHDGDKLGSG